MNVLPPFSERVLFYRTLGNRIEVEESLAAFADRQRIAAPVDLQWVAAYLAGIPAEPGETAFVGVRQLMPGEELKATASHGTVTVPRPKPTNSRDRGQAAIRAYRDAIFDASSSAATTDDLTAVELGPALWHHAVLTLTTNKYPFRDPRLWGVGSATFHKARDSLLRTADLYGLAGADIICGWPGEGTMWRRWYRLGASVLGQPTYHANLAFIPLLEAAKSVGAQRLVTAGRGEETGGHFWPPVTSPPQPPNASLRLRRRLKRLWPALNASTAGRWQPGPLLRCEVIEDFKLRDVARERWESQLRAAEVTGYLGFGPTHFHARAHERLTTRRLLGRHFGVEVSTPLHDGHVIEALRTVPREENKLGDLPGGAMAKAIGGRAAGDIDWNARRWPGNEIPKTSDQAARNRQARAGYLRERLHPLLAELVDTRVLEKQLREGRQPSQARSLNTLTEAELSASVEFAHIEAVNHWLEVWDL